MPIRQLAPDVAAKIAAGEVVERPASVVKELIENSIDAGATQIRVDLMNGGLQLIRVTDNGCGIPAEELALALARHATSKVEQIDDLEHIHSLGFRGEALASIAAVAEVTLLSRQRGAAHGAQVSASNGRISEVSIAASPEGTTLTVRNLFSAVPARLKFLKSRNTEISHCHHLLEQYALAYPEIRFSVYSEGRPIFATPGDAQLSSVLIEIYGLQVTEQMVPISSLDGTEKDQDSERPIVTGYTSLPACYKSTRQHMSFFVNRRWVLSRMLSYAVEEAYHSLLLPGRHPIAVVNIALDPSQIDVNVHPAKTEIRFLREKRVYAAILRAVRKAVLEEATIPEWGNGNLANSRTSNIDRDDESEKRETAISAIEEGGEEAVFTAPVNTRIDSSIDSEMEPGFSPGAEDVPAYPRDNPWLTVTEEETGTKPPLLSRLWQSHVRGPEPVQSEPAQIGSQANLPIVTTPELAPEKIGNAALSWETGAGVSAPPGNAGTLIQSRHLPPLRVVGQLSQSYIVTEGPDGMYLIDQHAAHERILLEHMVAALETHTPLSQLLLTPIVLDLAPNEVESIEDHLQDLEQIGFSLELRDDSTLHVKAVPNVLIKQMNARSVRELLAELTAPEDLGHGGTWQEHALANVACKAAIKANYFLTVSEMREMIEQLEHTNAPYSCCHGRPTMVHFSLSALEREFGRR
jgi:DNA mismatch repair protein MutL